MNRMTYKWIICLFAIGITLCARSADEWPTLRLKNHPKARELDFSIQYPPEWIVSEGHRPHVVKKITNGPRIFTIVVNTFPEAVSTEEANTLFTQDDIKEILPKGAHFVSCRKTKLEGQTAWIVVYSLQAERLGTRVTVMTINCILVYRKHMLQLQSSFCLLPADITAIQTSPALQAKYKAYFMETMQMFNTLVLNDRYR